MMKYKNQELRRDKEEDENREKLDLVESEKSMRKDHTVFIAFSS